MTVEGTERDDNDLAAFGCIENVKRDGSYMTLRAKTGELVD